MDDILLIEAAERYVKSEMTAEEKVYFEELRKTNPELDQLVVEHIYFFNELNKYSDVKKFKHELNETVSKLQSEGFQLTSSPASKSKVVRLWHRSKRTIAVAASIAGIVSIFIASLVSNMSSNKAPNTKLLVKELDDKLDKQADKTRQIERKLNNLELASTPLPVEIKPSKFRATGFLIDAGNNLIVTNAHVIREASHQIIVENDKGERFLAESIYVNADNDLAILKVTDREFKKLPPMPYTIKRTNANLGEQVFMLGYPKQEIVYGEGYVSAKNGYQMDTIYCQLSTSANEGNSGSPVINKAGELLGIVTSMETNSPGVVFAIKSPNIYKALDEVKKLKDFDKAKITSSPSLKGLDRENQIKKVQDYIFMIKGN